MDKDDVYRRVEEFTRQQLWEPSGGISPDTRLVEDIGIVGPDGRDFIEAYSKEFDVDMSGFDWFEHFGSEALGCILLIPIFRVFRIGAVKKESTHQITIQDLTEWACSGRWEGAAGRDEA